MTLWKIVDSRGKSSGGRIWSEVLTRHHLSQTTPESSHECPASFWKTGRSDEGRSESSEEHRAKGSEGRAMFRFEDLQIWQRATESLVLGSWFLVPGSWFLVLGLTKHEEQSTCDLTKHQASSHSPLASSPSPLAPRHSPLATRLSPLATNLYSLKKSHSLSSSKASHSILFHQSCKIRMKTAVTR